MNWDRVLLWNGRPTVPAGVAASALTSLILVLAVSAWSAIATASPLSDAAERALAAGEWRQVAQLVAPADSVERDPVALFVRAHTLLATNQNNESYCLLLSALTGDSLAVRQRLRAWEAWTGAFAGRYPSSVAANYLLGDALVRAGKRDEGIARLTHAMELALPQARDSATVLSISLCRSARGVARAAAGDLAGAKEDFTKATAAPETALADAHANTGALWIQRRDGAPGAIRAFSRAIEISPMFALALHGRSCLEVVSDNLAKAGEDQERAASLAVCSGATGLFAMNWIRLDAYHRGIGEAELLAALTDSSRGAGMFMDRSVTGFNDRAEADFNSALGSYRINPTQGKYNQMIKQLNGMASSQREQSMGMIQSMASQSFSFNQSLTQHANESASWNKYWGQVWGPFGTTLSAFTGAGAAAGMGALTGGNAFAAGATGALVGEATKSTFRNYGAATNKYYDSSRDILGGLQSSFGSEYKPPGGVDASWSRAVWEDGEWPFLPIYGLLYDTSQLDVLAGLSGRGAR